MRIFVMFEAVCEKIEKRNGKIKERRNVGVKGMEGEIPHTPCFRL